MIKANREPICLAEGYGDGPTIRFSYGKSQLPAVINYIENQEEHHRTRTFLEEYRRFLDVFDIEYDERYLFKPLD